MSLTGKIDNKVTQVKVKYFPNLKPKEVELHAYEIFGRKELFRRLNSEKNRELIN